MADKVTLRPAIESDVPAITSLFLTSFRQFPLFAYLLSPLNTNLDHAHDTIWYWRRRLIVGLLDPGTQIVVAEAEKGSLEVVEGRGEAWEQGMQTLEWVERNGLSTTTIWRVRRGEGNEGGGLGVVAPSFWSRFRMWMIKLEVSAWNKIYQRRDQDPVGMAIFHEAEEELEKKFYQKSCYYLDNACVDFRYQRCGIGKQLLQWGLDVAREKKLSVATEASPQGLGLYTKLGMKQVGWLEPKTGENEEKMKMPVLRLDWTHES